MPEKLNDGETLFDGFVGVAEIEIVGNVLSRIKLRLSDDVFSDASVWATVTDLLPSPAANVTATLNEPAGHVVVAGAETLPEILIVRPASQLPATVTPVWAGVSAAGDVMKIPGAPVSIVQVYAASLETFPATSIE